MAQSSLIPAAEIIVIGGSAGSLDVILRMLPVLKPDLKFPVVIVLHRKSSFDSSLTDLFTVKTSIPVKEAEEKETLRAGVIYLAPADYHLLIEKDRTFSMDYSERVNYSRPSIDVTFETAVEAYGSRVAGILLSGANADGTEGLSMIHQAGGITAAQNPATAEVAYMPRQAIANKVVNYVLNNDQIAYFINTLSDHPFYSE